MTQTSYNNYAINVRGLQTAAAMTYVSSARYDRCNQDIMLKKLKMLTMYSDVLCHYTPPVEDLTGEYADMCLKPEQMKCIGDHINKLAGVSYCINFILD